MRLLGLYCLVICLCLPFRLVMAQSNEVVIEPEVLVKLDTDYLIYAYPGVPQLVNGHVLASLNFMADRLILKVSNENCKTFTVESPSKKLEFMLNSASYALTNKGNATTSTLEGEPPASPFDFKPNITDTGFWIEDFCDALVPINVLSQAFELKTIWEEESRTLFVESNSAGDISVETKEHYSSNDVSSNTYYAFSQYPDIVPSIRVSDMHLKSEGLNEEGVVSFTAKSVEGEPENFLLYYITRFPSGATSNANLLHPEEQENSCKLVDTYLDCTIFVEPFVIDTRMGSEDIEGEMSFVNYIWFGFTGN
jgi:hypothetical protein